MKYVKKYELYGINKDVELLTDIVLSKYNNESYFKITDGLPLNIKKIIIIKVDHISHDGEMSFNRIKSKYNENGHILYFKIKKDCNPSESLFQHEITHAYQFIKAKGKISKDILLPFLNIKGKNEFKKFLEIMYFIQYSEIEAYYQYDLRLLKNNQNYKNGSIYEIFNMLKNFNIDYFFKTINENDLKKLVYFYYYNRKKINNKPTLLTIIQQNLNNFIKNILDIKDDINISKQEIDNFIIKIKKQYELKKKIIVRYLSKLNQINYNKIYEKNLKRYEIDKHLKKFERLEEYPFEIGDYVKLDNHVYSWVQSGIYGKINNTIFKIKEVDESDNTYYLDELKDWFRRNQLEKATPEEIENFKLKKLSNKYNV